MRGALNKVRAVARAIAIVATTGVLWVVWTVGTVALLAAPDLRRRWRYAIMRGWSRALVRIAGIEIVVDGPVPQPPFLLVANHLSYVDIIVLSSLVDCCYVSRGDVEHWPVVGTLCKSMRVIFVDRGRRSDVGRVSRVMAERLAEGEGVTFFPEGTSTAGDRIIPFKPSLFDCAVQTRVPVHYAALGYATGGGQPPAFLTVCWWGDMPFFSHFVSLLELKHVRATVTFGSEPIAGEDRKELARELWSAIDAQFTPVVEPETVRAFSSEA